MTRHFELDVEPTNPGQFLACCGLLELAAHFDLNATGWFSERCFHLNSDHAPLDLLRALVDAEASEVTERLDGLEVPPLIAPLRLEFRASPRVPMVLDGWMRVRAEKGVVQVVAQPPWNFWSGQQTPRRIWGPLCMALTGQLAQGALDGRRLFFARIPVSGRFGFDPGAAWNALDVGFSPNEQKLDVASSPVVELLAAVGLQRCRPRLLEERDQFCYATWGQPLPPRLAAAAAAGLVRFPPTTVFDGRVVSRGSYSALAYATAQGE